MQKNLEDMISQMKKKDEKRSLGALWLNLPDIQKLRIGECAPVVYNMLTKFGESSGSEETILIWSTANSISKLTPNTSQNTVGAHRVKITFVKEQIETSFPQEIGVIIPKRGATIFPLRKGDDTQIKNVSSPCRQN